MPDLLFTSEMSALLMEPSTFRSSRKFELPTDCPDCDFVWLMSAELTAGSALVSPISTPICGPTTLAALPVESTTLFKVTVRYWALLTSFRFTMYL